MYTLSDLRPCAWGTCRNRYTGYGAKGEDARLRGNHLKPVRSLERRRGAGLAGIMRSATLTRSRLLLRQEG